MWKTGILVTFLHVSVLGLQIDSPNTEEKLQILETGAKADIPCSYSLSTSGNGAEFVEWQREMKNGNDTIVEPIYIYDALKQEGTPKNSFKSRTGLEVSRTKMSSSPDGGSKKRFVITIPDVTLADEGKYWCVVTVFPLENPSNLRSPEPVVVTVNVKPNKPTLKHEKLSYDTYRLTCRVSGGKPLPNVRFNKNYMELSDEQKELSYWVQVREDQDDQWEMNADGTYDLTSVMNITFTYSAYYTCTAEHETGNQRSNWIHLTYTTTTIPINTTTPLKVEATEPTPASSVGSSTGIAVGLGIGAVLLLAIVIAVGCYIKKSKEGSHKVPPEENDIDHEKQEANHMLPETKTQPTEV